MNIRDLKPASQIARRNGVKSIIYGAPGSGKTPLIQTVPRPVLCVIEPGMLSMRKVDNVPCWEAYTVERIDEFFEWLTKSKEASQFDTVGIDSVSEMAEVALRKELGQKSKGGNQKHGQAAYGDMGKWVQEKLETLYHMQQKHVYLIAKQGSFEEDGAPVKKPYFPGNYLNTYVPHLFDEVLHVGTYFVGGQNRTAIRTRSANGVFARDRSGNLEELEAPHIGNIFSKAML